MHIESNLVDYAQTWQDRWLAGNIPGWTTKDLSNAIYQSRYLSNSGRLFFNSSDALVPADVNGKEDVYEYEPAGVGSCQAPELWAERQRRLRRNRQRLRRADLGWYLQ